MSNTDIAIPLTSIVKQGKEYISASEQTYVKYGVFLDDEIGPPSNYRDLIELLFNAGEDDIITLYINSEGGHLDTAIAIVEGLKHTQAHVVALLIGACHSAASIIMMYCDEVVVMDNAYSMIHTASFGSAGSTGNVKAHTEFTVKLVERILNETYEGFLTKEELARVKQGVELWFGAEEIRDRIGRRIKHLTKIAKKDLASTG